MEQTLLFLLHTIYGHMHLKNSRNVILRWVCTAAYLLRKTLAVTLHPQYHMKAETLSFLFIY
jgi:hypothetical protein